MRIKALAKVLVAGLTSGSLLLLSVAPAMAHTGGTVAGFPGGIGGTDPIDDPVDPLLSQNTPQHQLSPGTYHNANTGQVDIKSWEVKRITFPNGQAGLEARWTVDGNLPQPDVIGTIPATNPYPSFNGYSFDIFFHNKNVQTNNPASPRNEVCNRGVQGNPDPLGKKVYSNYAGHWLDSYWFQVGISLSYSGGAYEATPQFSYYYPGADGGFRFWDFKSEGYMNPGRTLTNPYTGKGQFYDWGVIDSPTGDTMVLRVVTNFLEKSTSCEREAGAPITQTYGPATYKFLLPGETASNVSAKTWLNQLVILPAPIPLSQIPIVGDDDFLGEDDIEAIGGFIYSEDWSQKQIGASTVEDYELGIFGPDQLTTDSGFQAGLRCWTPTVGGTLPRNPLWIDNQPCGADNPVGSEYALNGHDFVF